MRKFIAYFASTVVILTFQTAWGATSGGGIATLGVIRQRLRSHAERLDQLYVEYSIEGELRVSRELAAKITDRLVVWPRLEAVSAFKDQKVFLREVYRPEKDEVIPSGIAAREVSYDGNTTHVFYSWVDRRRKAGYGDRGEVWPGYKPVALLSTDTYMAYHGRPWGPFWIGVGDTHVESFKLPDVLKDGEYHVRSALEPCADGTPCVIVTSAGERIFLDPKLDLALRQRDWFWPGSQHVATRLSLKDHTEVLEGVYMAKTIFRDDFANPERFPELDGKPYYTDKLKVSELRTNPVPDDLFHLEFKAGTYVTDMSKIPASPETGYPIVAYTIPDLASDVEKVIQKATAARIAAEKRMTNRGFGTRARWLLIAINVVVGLVVAVVLWRRRVAPRS